MVVTLLVAEAAMVELIPPGESRRYSYASHLSIPRFQTADRIAYKTRCRRSLRHFCSSIKRGVNTAVNVAFRDIRSFSRQKNRARESPCFW
jgi:hypothetical protein